MRRSLLRKQLIKAWRRTIEDSYQSQLINSERGLQVYFCSALLNIFAEDNVSRRIFIEPRILTANNRGYRYPDIVICNTKHIIGVVELKYLPRGKAGFKKDLGTLEFVATNPCDITISNDRFLGIATEKGRPYSLSASAVLCWGGVYTGKKLNLPSEVSDTVRSRFLQLDAVTTKEGNPILFPCEQALK